MERYRTRITLRTILVCMVAIMIIPNAGCNILFHLLHHEKMVRRQHDIEGAKVVVLCAAADNTMGPDSVERLLPRKINRLLKQQVKDANTEIISQSKVDQWCDERGEWRKASDIGHGLDADVVIQVNLTGYELLPKGGSLWKGHAEYNLFVYDRVESKKLNKLVLVEDFPSETRTFDFPKHTGYQAASMTEIEFQRLFLNALSTEIARKFYDYKAIDDIAPDQTIMR